MRPPGLDGLLGMYAAVRVLRDPRAFVDEQAARFGRVFTTRMPDGSGRLGHLYWLLGPEANERILAHAHKADFTWYGGYRYTMEPIIGRDVLTLLDDAPGCPAHKERLRRVAPLFHPQLDNVYAAIMEDTTARHVARWPVGARFDLQLELKRIAFSTIARVVTGAALDELPDLLRDFETLGVGLFSVLRYDLPGTRFGRARRARDRIAAFLRRCIEALRQDASGSVSVIGQLLAPSPTGEPPLSDETLIAESMSFNIMGYDTLSSLLTSLFAALGDHPAVRRAVIDEVRALPDLSPASLAGAVHLDRALLETERLHPPLVFCLRGVQRSFTFDGFDVPAGEMVAFSAYYTGRMPQLFEDPLAFRPDRFDGAAIPPYALLAFGGGHRACIGKRFARLESKLIAAAVLRRFDVALLPRSEAVYFNPTLQRRHGLPARVSLAAPRAGARTAHVQPVLDQIQR